MSAASVVPRPRPRIAWCTSTVFPEVYRHLGLKSVVNCPWKPMLLERARATMEAEWLVLAQGKKDLECDFVADGVRHVVLGQKRRLQNWTYDWRGFSRAGEILAEWRPDLVHVHGSENYFGLLTARKMVAAPALIALQGLLEPYCRSVWGPFRRRDVLRIDRWLELIRGTGLMGLAQQWKSGAQREREVLRGNRWFAGRTEWDRAHLLAANPCGHYRLVHELLRPEFSLAKWSLPEAHRHTVFFTNLSGPHKGGDVLVEAVRILKQTIPGVRLRIGGSMSQKGGYAQHLMQAISRAGLKENVEFLGYLDAGRIAAELARAHVFASASFIDNSPNSVGEAMTVGVPCVCTYVGGLPSLGEPDRELVFCPAGDPPALAQAILKLFQNDALAERISVAARQKALAFHDAEETTRELRAVYREMLLENAAPGDEASATAFGI